MSNDRMLNCPFCHKQLVKDGDGYYTCYTDNCPVMSAGGNGASGSASLWLKLIQMRNVLKVAGIADKALDELMAPEQKETKCS